MNNEYVQDDIKPVVKLGEYVFDEVSEYELTEECEWVAALFEELEEQTDREEDGYSKGSISCDLKIKRKSGKPFGDHLLVRGNIKAKYITPCVRCLTLTNQDVYADFQVCFVPKRLENEPEFEELDDVFTENEEFALYFHDRGNADIAEMVHENLFMNIEHFPLHDEDCLGLCPECGQDLNVKICEHQTKN
jgi:uncharacterized protein